MTFYRRNLPHWHPEEKPIFITWRLFGSLPKGVNFGAATSECGERGTATPGCARTGKSAGATEWGRKFRIVDAELDRGTTGPLWLRDPKIARYVEEAAIRGEELGQYTLHAYVVMPNHVHVLLQPRVPLARVTGGIKGVSARDANVALGRIGEPFSQDESFDHWVRNEAEFRRICSYIERNPVMAGLVERPEDWPWSSAARKHKPRTGKSAGATW
jgi:REP element-mobilizing transposase RayT